LRRVDQAFRKKIAAKERKERKKLDERTKSICGSNDHRLIEKAIPIESGAVGSKPNCA
jgi:hypothetical protein